MHGESKGTKLDKITLEYPNEILMHITVTVGPMMYMRSNITRSITFYTNKRKHGPFGEQQGTLFTSGVKGKIVGCRGRHGLFLDSIGVHIVEEVPATKHHPSSNLTSKGEAEVVGFDYPQWLSNLVLTRQPPVEEVAPGIAKKPAPCGPGPRGGDGRQPWDDGVFSGISQIYHHQNPKLQSFAQYRLSMIEMDNPCGLSNMDAVEELSKIGSSWIIPMRYCYAYQATTVPSAEMRTVALSSRCHFTQPGESMVHLERKQTPFSFQQLQKAKW
ncbi:hypothetical protein MLD38_000780 [Melastoma candidum]|uniref:Uncharacterized protein n=1 Tax=Melastoma candidum TaxID=119954 RepID=A0ACB9SG40_9MYRT|nr:hypothetical protein MLD38_000780 [Melastoma candidum]